MALAALGEIAGSLAAALVATWPGLDPSAADASGRVTHLAVTSLVIGSGLSAWFAGSVAAFHEFVIAVIVVSVGTLARQAVMSRASGSSIGGILLVIAVVLLLVVPAEYWIWQSWSLSRVRATYRGLSRGTDGRDSSDRLLVARVRGRLRLLRRQKTVRTSELVEATADWYRAWLSAPDGVRGDEAGTSMFNRIHAAMTDLYGPPIDPAGGSGEL